MGSQKIRFVVERILTQKRLQQGRGVMEKIVLPDQGLISTEGGLGGGGGKAGLLEWLLLVKIMLLEREGHHQVKNQVELTKILDSWCGISSNFSYGKTSHIQCMG